MMTFKRIKYAVKSALLRLYSRHICPPPTDAKKIPVIINNFNRLTTLKRLIASLTSRGIENIIILDNASTYTPLLEWYKNCGHTVIHLEGNLGFKALWKSRLTKELYRKGWYIYTDSDVELAKDCPDDIIERMLHVMTVERPSALKTGPSLLINDLPDCFANKTDVIAHEQKFWEHREGDLFRAPIDTTFALYIAPCRDSIAPVRLKVTVWHRLTRCAISPGMPTAPVRRKKNYSTGRHAHSLPCGPPPPNSAIFMRLSESD